MNGYPTIKYFGSNKEKPEAYNGGRGEDDIVAFATIRWQAQLPPPEVRSPSPPPPCLPALTAGLHCCSVVNTAALPIHETPFEISRSGCLNACPVRVQ